MKTFCFLLLLVGTCFSQPMNWALWDITPECVPLIQDQGDCGDDLTIAAVEVLDINFCYLGYTNGLNDLSSDYAEECLTDGDCASVDWDDLEVFLMDEGTVTNECLGDMTGYSCPLDECENEDDPVFYKADDIEEIDADMQMIQLNIMKNGAVLAMVDTSQMEFYEGGILSCTEESNIDGALYLVGWGSNGTHGYWIGANSWGEFWGDEGYVLIDSDDLYDCGVSENSYSITAEYFNP